MNTLRIGTRASRLALWQAEHVKTLLEQAHGDLSVEIVKISTRGDRILDRPLAAIGGKGLFIKELEVALLDRSVDIAVHSLKDFPTEAPDGLELAVYPERAPVRDVLCAAEPGVTSVADLPKGARIGTGSLRRAKQLQSLRPDCEVISIRGNVETRLAKRQSEALDAVVLAEAGLRRLGIWEAGFVALEPEQMVPAPGQGSLAIETRRGDTDVAALIGVLDHAETRLQVAAERAALATIEGDCHTPFGASASFDGEGWLTLQLRLYRDGRFDHIERLEVAQGKLTESAAAAFGAACARSLLDA